MTRSVVGFASVFVSLVLAGCSDVDLDEPIDTDVGRLTFGACGDNCSSWVYPSSFAPNHLIYVPDSQGDRIPDFGRVGYMKSRGGLLTDTMPPLGPRTDYTSNPLAPPPNQGPTGLCAFLPGFHHGDWIQAALDDLANQQPDASGVKGHLYLPRGYYAVWNPIVVPDRVVLMGQGAYPSLSQPPTTLVSCGTAGGKTLITVTHPQGTDGVVGSPIPILDEVVPVGSTGVTVGVSTIQRGDRIKITRQTTAAWVDYLGLGSIWTGSAALGDFVFERTVTHVEPVAGQTGKYRVFFEHPLTNALEQQWGSHFLQVFSAVPVRASRSGVYNLRGRSDDDSAEDFVYFEMAIDSWARDLVAEGFRGTAINEGGASRQITAQGVASIAPTGPIDGGFRYAFETRGHMNLIANATSDDGRHDFLQQQNATSGPNAFYNCTSTNENTDSGSHHDWARGTLFDNVTLQPKPGGTSGRKGEFTAANLSPSDGSNNDTHGWSGANLVFWNTTAAGYEVYNPPTAQNWLIGGSGPLGTPTSGLGESNPHFDFGDPAEHGTKSVLAGSISGSLYRTANAQWRAYLDQGYELEVRHYFIGDPDQPESGEIGDGTMGDSNDPVYVNPTFKGRVQNTWFGSNVATANFDVMVTNHAVPFTVRYQLEPGEVVVGGYLAARIERGTWGSDLDHHVTLASREFDTQRTTYYWRCNVVSPCIPATMMGPEGWPTSVTSPMVKILDLTGSFLPYLNNQSGGWAELNVNFFKRTRVDWAALTLLVRRG